MKVTRCSLVILRRSPRTKTKQSGKTLFLFFLFFSFCQDHREPESAVRLFGVDLLAGLQQTHACGYLHGDLRPSNVLIDEYGILKLSGFGLARGVSPEDEKADGEASLAGGGGIVGDSSSGTGSSKVGGEGYSKQGGASAKDAAAAVAEGRDPAYMAPELFSVGEQAMSFASDFWSLGCVLYELLTGEPPFRPSASATVAETIAREVRDGDCCDREGHDYIFHAVGVVGDPPEGIKGGANH